MEVKTKRVGDNELKDAIVKLNHYIMTLNFQYAVFVSVNTEFIHLIAQINQCFPHPQNNDWHERFKRIIVFNYYNQKLEIKRLFDLF